jgi:hypothetical protein
MFRLTPEHRAAGFDVAALVAQSLAGKAVLPDAPDYPRTRREYRLAVVGAVGGYLDSDKGIGTFKRQLGRAVIEAFSDAFYAGYRDAGGEETEAEDERWLTDRQGAELAYVDELFAGLKEKRKGEDFDADAEVDARADGYTATLDGVYTEGKLRGAKNKTLVFVGDDGEESCPDCQKMKGKRRTIKWILDNDAIPRPGNDFFECGGYRCQHYWEDPKTGERYTL